MLLSGFDTLVLAIDVMWQSSTFQETMRALLEEAKKRKEEVPFSLPEGEGDGSISFMVQPHGIQGFSWLLLGVDYCLKIMDWHMPGSRPNIMAELHSELLWRIGPVEAVSRLVAALELQGALVLTVKPSRVDACMDVLFPAEAWNPGLLDYAVTHAAERTLYHKHQVFSGLTLGKGVVSARIYDKALEIQAKSGKVWFYRLWGLSEVPEGKRAIRVEFQLRREAIKELGLYEIGSLFSGLAHLWAFCSETWLKFMSNPGAHHTQRETLPWWRTVQSSFLGVCEGEPLIRAAAIESDKKRLRQQATGLCSSLLALDREANARDAPPVVDVEDYARTMAEAVERLGKTQEELQEDIARKHARRARLQKKYDAAIRQRERLGLLVPDQEVKS